MESTLIHVVRSAIWQRESSWPDDWYRCSQPQVLSPWIWQKCNPFKSGEGKWNITKASVHDVNLLDQLKFEPGGYYILDRGYLDYRRLYRIHRHEAYFITRAKSITRFIGKSKTFKWTLMILVVKQRTRLRYSLHQGFGCQRKLRRANLTFAIFSGPRPP